MARLSESEVEALLAENSRYREALLLIRYECETFTGGARCSDEGSGRYRSASWGAFSWCHGCIVNEALQRPPKPRARPSLEDIAARRPPDPS